MALTYAQQLEQLSQDEHEQEEEEDVGRAALLARVGTESIWTVDLLFLLQARLLVFACMCVCLWIEMVVKIRSIV